jgi:hypothetical protein
MLFPKLNHVLQTDDMNLLGDNRYYTEKQRNIFDSGGKLRDYIPVMLATIQSRTFCLPICCQKMYKLEYTRL